MSAPTLTITAADVDRIASAIYEQINRGYQSVPSWDDLHDMQRERWRRAAIVAAWQSDTLSVESKEEVDEVLSWK